MFKNGSLFAALSSGLAICPSGVMVLSEVAYCASQWFSVVDRLQCRLRITWQVPRPNRFYEIDQPPSLRDFASRPPGENLVQAVASCVHW